MKARGGELEMLWVTVGGYGAKRLYLGFKFNTKVGHLGLESLAFSFQ
jgi:hypothetical protein